MGPGRGPTLAERTAATRAAELSRRPPRHCWLRAGPGLDVLPALLLEWRRDGQRWLGRVAVASLDAYGRAQLLEQWVDASRLEPTPQTGPAGGT